MGAIVDGEKRCVDEKKVAVFREMREPKTGKEVSSVLGFVNFLRNYIPLYACIFGPLESLRKMRRISEELWVSSGARIAFETKFKESVLNVLPHNLSHMYDLLPLDFGRGDKPEVVSEGKVCFVRASGRKEGDLEE